ncbi:hypothetical protein [Flectobacillus roseus]|uniref:Uncharacterized protein n=1 Tax=Flectobacillus roseus TaxID=502259 RepID=A0ABT6YE92_9BACT|nr:hypothetical protein [Flectobacillus roseus]MDI9861747.1 hypothetical protein [Flectobacillus roseus]
MLFVDSVLDVGIISQSEGYTLGFQVSAFSGGHSAKYIYRY